MTTNKNDTAEPEGDDPGILGDTGGADTISIPLLGGATAHVAVELHSDDDDDDFEADVIDDSISLSFDSLVAGDTPDFGAVTEAVVEAELVEEGAADEPSTVQDAAVDAAAEGEPDENLADDEQEGVAAPVVDTDAGDDTVVVDTGARATHDEVVAEPIPTPQPAAAARVSHDLERVTRPEAGTMASKRFDDLANAERETSDLLTADRLLDPHQVVHPEPEGPWRQLVYSLSGHRINLGASKKAIARKALDERISAALPGGARFVPVLSRKGGVGKTTITTLLGMALADARDDRVIAVDANPDRGTLAERIARPSGKTVRDLVRGRDQVQGYNDVSTIVTRDETRLDVLASDTDPHVSEAFSDEDYRHVADIAAHYYSIVLTDTGTGIVHSVMGATLEAADQLVVVAGMSVDEARLASETLTWLESNGFDALVRGAIVVLNTARPGAPVVRQDEVESHFRTRVRDVVRVPYDPQIAAGSAIRFAELQPETRLAARTLAAKVVEGLRGLPAAA